MKGIGSEYFNLAAWSPAEFMDYKELHKISKRRAIAAMLLDGATYKEISKTLHVSSQTIAKVSRLLKRH